MYAWFFYLFQSSVRLSEVWSNDTFYKVFYSLCCPFNLLFHIVPSPLCIKLCTKPIKNEDCTRDKKTGIGTGLSHALLHSDLLLFSLQSNFKKVCGTKSVLQPRLWLGEKEDHRHEKKARALTWICIFARRQKHMTLYVFCHIWWVDSISLVDSTRH